jgi:uncharacterized protein YoxC
MTADTVVEDTEADHGRGLALEEVNLGLEEVAQEVENATTRRNDETGQRVQTRKTASSIQAKSPRAIT